MEKSPLECTRFAFGSSRGCAEIALLRLASTSRNGMTATASCHPPKHLLLRLRDYDRPPRRQEWFPPMFARPSRSSGEIASALADWVILLSNHNLDSIHPHSSIPNSLGYRGEPTDWVASAVRIGHLVRLSNDPWNSTHEHPRTHGRYRTSIHHRWRQQNTCDDWTSE
jgi:hypothetical protein